MRGVDLGVSRHHTAPRDAERFLVPLLSSIARVADDRLAASSVVGPGWPTRLAARLRRCLGYGRPRVRGPASSLSGPVRTWESCRD